MRTPFSACLFFPSVHCSGPPGVQRDWQGPQAARGDEGIRFEAMEVVVRRCPRDRHENGGCQSLRLRRRLKTCGQLLFWRRSSLLATIVVTRLVTPEPKDRYGGKIATVVILLRSVRTSHAVLQGWSAFAFFYSCLWYPFTSCLPFLIRRSSAGTFAGRACRKSCFCGVDRTAPRPTLLAGLATSSPPRMAGICCCRTSEAKHVSDGSFLSRLSRTFSGARSTRQQSLKSDTVVDRAKALARDLLPGVVYGRERKFLRREKCG